MKGTQLKNAYITGKRTTVRSVRVIKFSAHSFQFIVLSWKMFNDHTCCLLFSSVSLKCYVIQASLSSFSVMEAKHVLFVWFKQLKVNSSRKLSLLNQCPLQTNLQNMYWMATLPNLLTKLHAFSTKSALVNTVPAVLYPLHTAH